MVSTALSKARESSEFGDDAWLTFYLVGDPQILRLLASDLAILNAKNLEGEEGGFLYAKLPIKLDANQIEAAANKMSELAARHGIIVDHIDLDSSEDVTSSTFFCLSGGQH